MPSPIPLLILCMSGGFLSIFISTFRYCSHPMVTSFLNEGQPVTAQQAIRNALLSFIEDGSAQRAQARIDAFRAISAEGWDSSFDFWTD